LLIIILACLITGIESGYKICSNLVCVAGRTIEQEGFMKRLVIVVWCLVMSSLPFAVQAGEQQTKGKDIKIMTTDELKQIYDARKDFMLVNALSPIEYAEERIKGSVNIPYMHLKAGSAKLPDDKNKMLVFYCKGPK